MRIGRRRFLRAQHAGQQAGHGIYDHHRGNLTAGEHKVADAQLLGGEMISYPFVEPLVVAADQGETLLPGKALGIGLPEDPALGCKQDHRTSRRRA